MRIKTDFPISLLFCSAILFLACQVKVVNSEEINPNPKIEVKSTPVPANNEPITIAAGGDVMIGSTFPNETRMPPNDGADTFKAVAPVFQKADIAFANLEGPMIDGGISEKCPPPKPPKEIPPKQIKEGQPPPKVTCFAFKMPTRYGKYLKEAGFDVMSIANNHAGDFGEEGRISTRRVLDDLEIKHAGGDRFRNSTTYLEVKGKKIAFIGFAHNNISPNVNDLTFARQLVEQASKKADLIIVSFHGGAEGATQIHVPQRTELFYGEERGNLPLFAKTVIDAGADLVLGHGPHVLRGMEIYKDRLIAYSLGNFATYGWFQLSGATAETMVLEITLEPDGKFLSGKINPFVLRDRGILTADTTGSAIKTLRALSVSDFPATAPKIADDGTISVK